MASLPFSLFISTFIPHVYYDNDYRSDNHYHNYFGKGKYNAKK